MILLEISDLRLTRHADPRSAGVAYARHIAEHGFSEFSVDFGGGVEIEWTDPDLFLEPADLEYFGRVGVPRAFVKKVFINWQAYSAHCRHHNLKL